MSFVLLSNKNHGKLKVPSPFGRRLCDTQNPKLSLFIPFHNIENEILGLQYIGAPLMLLTSCRLSIYNTFNDRNLLHPTLHCLQQGLLSKGYLSVSSNWFKTPPQIHPEDFWHSSSAVLLLWRKVFFCFLCRGFFRSSLDHRHVYLGPDGQERHGLSMSLSPWKAVQADQDQDHPSKLSSSSSSGLYTV